jgi:virulence-associated protein VapD
MVKWWGGSWVVCGLLAGTLVFAGAACGSRSDKSTHGGGSNSLDAKASTGETAAVAPAVPNGAAPEAQRQQAAAMPTSGQQAQPLQGQPGQSMAQPIPSLDRKIVSTVFLDLTVKDVSASVEQVQRLAQDSGGFVAESNVRYEGKERRASITIRVPAARYLDVLSAVRGLAVKVETERASANDVTEEYTDLRSRLRNLEATEQQLLTYLTQAKNMQETFQVHDRINQVRLEIDRIKGRINLYDRLTDLATIQVQLRPETAVAPDPAVKQEPSGAVAALRRGWDASTALLGGVAMVMLTVLAFSWWLLPVAALAVWVARRERRRRSARLVPAAASGNTDAN